MEILSTDNQTKFHLGELVTRQLVKLSEQDLDIDEILATEA